MLWQCRFTQSLSYIVFPHPLFCFKSPLVKVAALPALQILTAPWSVFHHLQRTLLESKAHFWVEEMNSGIDGGSLPAKAKEALVAPIKEPQRVVSRTAFTLQYRKKSQKKTFLWTPMLHLRSSPEEFYLLPSHKCSFSQFPSANIMRPSPDSSPSFILQKGEDNWGEADGCFFF